MPEGPSLPEIAAKAAIAALPNGGIVLTVLNGFEARRTAELEAAVGFMANRVGSDVLAAIAMGDTELSALLGLALEAILRSGYEDKRKLLAKVVVDAIENDDRIDESQLITMALAELEGPHIRALARLAHVQETVAPSDDENPVFDAGKREPLPVRSTLIRTGVVDAATVVGGGTEIWRVNEFGSDLLAALEDSA